VDDNNLELVEANIQDLYQIALRESESEKSKMPTRFQGLRSLTEAAQAHRKNSTVTEDDLESRLECLRGGSSSAL
jgi:hypothetical protein